MVKVIHYIKLESQDQVLKLTKELESLRKNNSLRIEVAAACSRIIEKASPGRYLILDGNYQGSLAGQLIFIIQNASVWCSKPQTYAGCERDDYRLGLPTAEVSTEYSKFLGTLKSIFNTNSNLNSKNNGKDQDQLQGKADSDSRSYEGSILHCGGNRPQLTAGRHCDQAGVEVKRTRVGGGKIYLSTRRPEVLGSRLSGRQPQGVPQESSQASGVTRLQSDGSRVASVGFPIPYGILLRFCKSQEDCEKVGDFYKSGGLFHVVTGVNTEKHSLIFQRMV